MCTHLTMRETVKESPLLDVLDLQHDISVAATAGGGNNILVEGERNEDNDDE